MAEVHAQHVAAAFPWRVLGPWDLAVPLQHVCGAVLVFNGFRHDAKRVVASPVFPLFLEAVDNELVYLFFLHLL